MSGIFISYRREDSAGWAGRLASLLRGRFRADELFMDIHTIEPGMDFIDALSERLRSCEVLLAVIGPHWLSVHDRSGRPRLQDPNDYVRLEIATALQRNIRVIPVLVGDTPMPTVADLPDGLGMLARRQAYELSDTRWDYDATQLIRTLETILGKPAPKTPEPEKSAVGAAKEVSLKRIIGLYVLLGFIAVAGLISVLHQVGVFPFNGQIPPLPLSNLEQKLSNANIRLSEGNDSQVREWLNTDRAYQALAQLCLNLLGDRKVIHPIPLDVINSKYKQLYGLPPNEYLSPNNYRNMEKLKTAIFQTWGERHREASQNSFDTVVEGISKAP